MISAKGDSMLAQRLLVSVITSFALSSAAFAGSISSSMVPSEVKAAFQKQYPSAQILEWDYEDDEKAYEVEARIGKAEIDAMYSEKGDLIASKEDVAVGAIPKDVLDEVRQKWQRAEILGANKITTPKGITWDIGLKIRSQYHNVKVQR